VNLPEWPENLPIERGSMRWDVSYVGQEKSEPIVLGPELLQNATHVTHASKDF
jgi:hypothetical protein